MLKIELVNVVCGELHNVGIQTLKKTTTTSSAIVHFSFMFNELSLKTNIIILKWTYFTHITHILPQWSSLEGLNIQKNIC